MVCFIPWFERCKNKPAALGTLMTLVSTLLAELGQGFAVGIHGFSISKLADMFFAGFVRACTREKALSLVIYSLKLW